MTWTAVPFFVSSAACLLEPELRIHSRKMEIGYIFGIFIVVAIVARIIAGRADDGRVRDYIAERGGRLVSCEWTPFGTGWFGEKSDRIYEVVYIDKDGNEHHAECKTSMTTGVYFTEDRITRAARRPVAAPKPASRLSELERENQQLREELRKAREQES
jgi:hypothetical protein